MSYDSPQEYRLPATPELPPATFSERAPDDIFGAIAAKAEPVEHAEEVTPTPEDLALASGSLAIAAETETIEVALTPDKAAELKEKFHPYAEIAQRVLQQATPHLGNINKNTGQALREAVPSYVAHSGTGTIAVRTEDGRLLKTGPYHTPQEVRDYAEARLRMAGDPGAEQLHAYSDEPNTPGVIVEEVAGSTLGNTESQQLQALEPGDFEQLFETLGRMQQAGVMPDFSHAQNTMFAKERETRLVVVDYDKDDASLFAQKLALICEGIPPQEPDRAAKGYSLAFGVNVLVANHPKDQPLPDYALRYQEVCRNQWGDAIADLLETKWQEAGFTLREAAPLAVPTERREVPPPDRAALQTKRENFKPYAEFARQVCRDAPEIDRALTEGEPAPPLEFEMVSYGESGTIVAKTPDGKYLLKVNPDDTPEDIDHYVESRHRGADIEGLERLHGFSDDPNTLSVLVEDAPGPTVGDLSESELEAKVSDEHLIKFCQTVADMIAVGLHPDLYHPYNITVGKDRLHIIDYTTVEADQQLDPHTDPNEYTFDQHLRNFGTNVLLYRPLTQTPPQEKVRTLPPIGERFYTICRRRYGEEIASKLVEEWRREGFDVSRLPRAGA